VNIDDANNETTITSSTTSNSIQSSSCSSSSSIIRLPLRIPWNITTQTLMEQSLYEMIHTTTTFMENIQCNSMHNNNNRIIIIMIIHIIGDGHVRYQNFMMVHYMKSVHGYTLKISPNEFNFPRIFYSVLFIKKKFPFEFSYTCILYMNDNNWDVNIDGGTLRLYPNTQHIYNPMDVTKSDRFKFVDIAPTNGRLLIFDACLVHSVQKVTSVYKQRRALTLWINRPNYSGVRGEMY
jgi:hypothetical protein